MGLSRALTARAVIAILGLVLAGCGRGPSEVLYAAGSKLQAIDPGRGRTLWSADLPAAANDVSVSGNGAIVAVATSRGLAVFDAARGEPVATWSLGSARAVAVSGDGRYSYVLTNGRSGSPQRVYCAMNREKYIVWNTPLDPPGQDLELSPEGKTLVASAATGAAYFLLDLPADDRIPGRPLHSGFARVSLDSSLARSGVSPDVRYRCVSIAPGGVLTFLEESGRTIRALRRLDPPRGMDVRLPLEGPVDTGPSSAAGGGSALFIASVSRLLVIDAATGRVGKRIELGRAVTSLASSRGGTRIFLAEASRPGGVIVADPSRGRIVRRIPLDGAPTVIALGPRPPKER